jgi:ribosome recycling factor
MINEVLSDVSDRMSETLNAIRRDLSRLRTGRASPSLLDHVRVDYYGNSTPLNQMASISTPEARLLQIKPWDQTTISAIERALYEANLGSAPQNDGEVIRLPFPPTTEERRREFAKEVWVCVEDGKVSVRSKRREGNDMLKELEREGEISEDQLKGGLSKIQEMTDQSTNDLDAMGKKKEQEILTV